MEYAFLKMKNPVFFTSSAANNRRFYRSCTTRSITYGMEVSNGCYPDWADTSFKNTFNPSRD